MSLATAGGWLVLAATVAGQQSSDTIVRVVSTPRHPGVATLVPEVSIGSGTGEAEYTFTHISEIVPVPDGSVILVDVPYSAGGRGGRRSPAAVRMYDVKGRYIRPVGRDGQGPGEYLNPSGLARLPDGRVLLRDASLHRINVYSPTGESVATWRIDELTNNTSSGSGLLMVDQAGVIYLQAREPARTSDGRPVVPLSVETKLIRLRANGTVIDTLSPPALPDIGPPQLVAQRPGRSTSMSVPYSAATWWVWSPLGYFLTGRTDRYAIDLRVPPTGTARSGAPPTWRLGDPVISIRRSVDAVAVTSAERAEHRSTMDARMRAVDPTWNWSGPDIPRVKPAYRRVTVADDGRLWVLASLPSERVSPPADARPGTEESMTLREPPVYDVYEPGGVYLGRVRVPDNVQLKSMRGDTVWGVTTDDDDVPSATRFRVAWK
jgi:hypothetical protein